MKDEELTSVNFQERAQNRQIQVLLLDPYCRYLSEKILNYCLSVLSQSYYYRKFADFKKRLLDLFSLNKLWNIEFFDNLCYASFKILEEVILKLEIFVEIPYILLFVCMDECYLKHMIYI